MEEVVCADFDNYPPLHPTTVRNNRRRSNATEYVVLDTKYRKLSGDYRLLEKRVEDAEHNLRQLRASVGPLVRAVGAMAMEIDIAIERVKS